MPKVVIALQTLELVLCGYAVACGSSSTQKQVVVALWHVAASHSQGVAAVNVEPLVCSVLLVAVDVVHLARDWLYRPRRNNSPDGEEEREK